MRFAGRVRPRHVLEWTVFGLSALMVVGEAWATVGWRLSSVSFGSDLQIYLPAAERWLSGGGFYLPHQLIGPYELQVGDILYPPITLLLFLPFLVLPWILWWTIPIASLAWVLNRLRPSLLGWSAVLVLCAVPYGIPLFVSGNPVLWAVAALALGTIYGWPAAAVAIKPSVFPFALFGMRHRSWWYAIGALALTALPFLPLWFDYARALINVRVSDGLLYSATNIPLMLIPIVAWATRTRPTGSGRRTGAPDT